MDVKEEITLSNFDTSTSVAVQSKAMVKPDATVPVKTLRTVQPMAQEVVILKNQAPTQNAAAAIAAAAVVVIKAVLAIFKLITSSFIELSSLFDNFKELILKN